MTTRYLTVVELKTYMRSELTTEDLIFEAAINTAELILDNAAGRTFIVASGSSARVYRPSNGAIQIIDDCTGITSVVDNGATLAVGTDYQLEPLNGRSSSGEAVPYYALRRLGYYYNRWYNWYGVPNSATITVTANWGWAAIPAMIKEACKIVAKDVFLQRDTTGFGLVAITEAGGVGSRENWVVNQAVQQYAHPNAFGP